MNAIETFRTMPGVIRWDFGHRWWRHSIARCMAGLTAAVVGIALGGCLPTPTKPPGLTAAPDTAVDHNAAVPFSVGVIPNRAPPVRIGDELAFILSANATGYGHVYLLNASGGVLVLTENLPMAADRQTVFPAPGGTFKFRATPPAGMERVIFMMTRQPFRGFGGGASGPVQIPMQAQDFIDDLNEATGQLPEHGWAVAEARVEIVPAGG